MRLKREKTAMESTMAEYERQIVAKDHEITRLRKAKTSPLPHMVVPPTMTNEEKKLQISLVDRDAKVTQLTAERDLLQHDKDIIQQELHDTQAKYRALKSQHQAA